MRTRRRIKRIITTLLLLSVIGLVSYYAGYSHGQASVYLKAKNGDKLMKMEYSQTSK